MAEDEEQTVKTFRGHKQAFESLVTLHRGRVFNTAGDAILAEFGSAVEAVRCATEIQAALQTRNEQLAASRQVRFRIGVNLGDVMLHGTDLLGDGVNIAARLQAGAEPGGICISGSVYDQIRNKLSLSFRSMGEQKYKNIPQPVRTYSITGSEGLGELPFAKQRWPSLHGSGARWLLGLAVLSLITVAAYGSYPAYQRWKTTGAQDGSYQGQVCLGPIPEEAARCYMTSNISVHEGKISAKYPARDPALSNVIEGLISPAGEVRFELRLENSDGSRRNTAKLFGTLRDGRLTASGGTGNRTYNVDWHRF